MTRAVLIALICALAATVAFAQQRSMPPPPSMVMPPVWAGSVQMPDGRTFVTDGGLAVDVAVTKPEPMPSASLPAETGKVFESHLKASHTDEIDLADLKPGEHKNTFVGPRGIGVSGNYVNYLRKAIPKSRLRFRSDKDPIVIVLDGRAVGLLMPLAMAR
ncbi:MAG TPA: hypothetical protein VFV98_01400 [Vicinamibacterales bacterium]|nr:hypothetical protein [Vicinamibacterales bacterium]